ncbi:hypothetical protein D3C72_1598840 [compost metagenome]
MVEVVLKAYFFEFSLFFEGFQQRFFGLEQVPVAFVSVLEVEVSSHQCGQEHDDAYGQQVIGESGDFLFFGDKGQLSVFLGYFKLYF